MEQLTIKEVSELLDLPEITIMRWIKQGKIPFQMREGRYVFDKKQLINWANLHNIPLKEERKKVEEKDISLYEAIKKGGVFFDLEGGSVEEVLRNALNLLDLDVDKEELLEKLLQREELCSTGIGEGVALPHPRQPVKDIEPMIGVFFLKNEVDYHALDGKKVFVLFLILCPSTRLHLKLLSKLSFILRKKDFLSFLRKCKSKEGLLEKIKDLEAHIE